MSNRKSREDLFRWALGILIVSILLMRLVPVMRFFLTIILFLALAGLIGGLIWYFFVKRRRDQRYAASTEGQIVQRIGVCETDIAVQEKEIADIKENIQDLKKQLNAGNDIAPQHRRESEKLIKAFQAQLELRQSKIEFFQACIQKLNILLHNQRLASDLEVKKKKLEQLRENNFEELAKLESLRSDVEMEVLYLDTIDELSLKIQDTNTVDDAEFLQKELEKMTRELR